MTTPLERPRKKPPVHIDLFGDGVMRELRYTIGTMQRLKSTFGQAMLGLKGNLMNIDEEMVPILIHAGLRHDPTSRDVPCECGFHAANGVDPDVSIEEIKSLDVGDFNYLLSKFGEAFRSSRPSNEVKKTEVEPETTA